MKKALVSIIVGDQFRKFWTQHCERSWRQYAEKHGYEIVLIDRPIRPINDGRSIHWQKLLILELDKIKNYDRVVWLDSDILINTLQAPSIVDQVPEDKIGVTLFGDLQPSHLRPLVWERWAQAYHEFGMPLPTAQTFWPSYYKRAGLDSDANLRFNTGVLVLTPFLHSSFLSGVFEKYSTSALDFEQTYLNYELVRNGSHHTVDSRFNTQVGDELLKHYPFLFFHDDEVAQLSMNDIFSFFARLCLLTLYENNYFIHFCGARWHAPLLTDSLQHFGARNFRAITRTLLRPR